MIFLLLTFLFFSQFQCVFSEEKHIENANLFNEFVKVMFDMHPGPSEHEVGKKTLSVANVAEMLEMVEKNVAEKVLASSNVSDEEINENFTKILAEFKKLYNNEKMDNIERKINEKFTTQMDKVQFLILLLSLSTRLAFTIGSEALEKHHPHHPNKITMGSFVLAGIQLEDKFPVERFEIEYKFRYYQDAILTMEPESNIVLFNFTPVNESQQMHRKFNFDSIYFYLKEWPQKESVKSLIEQLKKIRTMEIRDPYVVGYKKSFLDRLMVAWTWMPQNDRGSWLNYQIETYELISLKNFGLNLAKLLHRKIEHAHEYVKENRKVKENLNYLLEQLENDEVLVKYRKQVADSKHFDFILQNEQLMHYEDAIQIDWRTKNEFSSMAKAKNDYKM